MSKFVAGAPALVVLCSGCASITQGSTHSLRIDTETAQGQAIDDADCELTNDQGTTTARSGSATIVRRSAKDLEVRCIKAGYPDASARLVSRANAGLAGNILLGGAIGAVVDHNSGAAYTYPSWIKLVFGEHATLDRRDETEGRVLAASPGSTTIVPMRAPAATPPGTIAAVPVAAAVPAAAGVPVAAAASPGALVRGDTFDYRITDRNTQRSRTVMLRVLRVDERQVTFNDGTRIERPNGELVTLGAPLLGELDAVTPPGGWLPGGRMPRGIWPVRFSTGIGADRKSYELTAQAGREQPIRVQAGQFQAVRIDIDGWFENNAGHIAVRAPYRATVWVSPELRRPIRFEVKSRSSGTVGTAGVMLDETAELVAISRD
ncbi:MAG: hypothetical protein KIT60_27375 [Burkholderiaceae bacterium]|nr:hypothetical protein [Burkholderiaceae bacterium]